MNKQSGNLNLRGIKKDKNVGGESCKFGSDSDERFLEIFESVRNDFSDPLVFFGFVTRALSVLRRILSFHRSVRSVKSQGRYQSVRRRSWFQGQLIDPSLVRQTICGNILLQRPLNMASNVEYGRCQFYGLVLGRSRSGN